MTTYEFLVFLFNLKHGFLKSKYVSNENLGKMIY